MSEQKPQIVKPPAEGEPPPAPTCPVCKRPMPGIYLYTFQLGQPAPLPTLMYQAICCPLEDCLAAVTILPAGQIAPKISGPGGFH
jgi:hypothetical protein